MGKRSPNTTNTQIRAALRQLFLRSRERGATIKRDKYTCQECGAKQSRAKDHEVYVEVHHKENVLNWDKLFAAVRENLLCDPEGMETLCKACHANHTEQEKRTTTLSTKAISNSKQTDLKPYECMDCTTKRSKTVSETI